MRAFQLGSRLQQTFSRHPQRVIKAGLRSSGSYEKCSRTAVFPIAIYSVSSKYLDCQLLERRYQLSENATNAAVGDDARRTMTLSN